MAKAVIVLVFEKDDDPDQWNHYISTATDNFVEGEITTVWAAQEGTAEKVIEFLEENTEDL
jgi:hypothetical protein